LSRKITDYFGVDSLSESSDEVVKLGGKILVPRMIVPDTGYFALRMDTEGSVFGLWEDDPQAK
jgi:uncharacterized protein